MSAKFWWDDEGQARDPAYAIKGLGGEIDQYVRPTIKALSPEAGVRIRVERKYAIFMSGTTDDLQKALTSDLDKGIERLEVEDGQLAVWYVRRKVGLQTESIVCIAGRGKGSGHYWDMHVGQKPADLGPPASRWKEMYTGGPGIPRPGEYSRFAFVTLADLRTKVLPKAKGEKAWYPGFPPR
jgi:hypothetical protein